MIFCFPPKRQFVHLKSDNSENLQIHYSKYINNSRICMAIMSWFLSILISLSHKGLPRLYFQRNMTQYAFAHEATPQNLLVASFIYGMVLIDLVHILKLISEQLDLFRWVLLNYCRDLQFKVDSEQQIFVEKLFMAILFALRIFAEICWEEIAVEIFFLSYFVLISDLGFESELYV